MKTRLDIIDTCDLYSEIIRKRNEKRISQEVLGKLVKKTRAQICLIETGKSNLSIFQAEEIFKQMGYSFQIALTEMK